MPLCALTLRAWRNAHFVHARVCACVYLQAVRDPLLEAMRADRHREVGWIRDFILDLADRAVDIQEETNAGFMKYAATAAACKRAYAELAYSDTHWEIHGLNSDAAIGGARMQEAAYEQAHVELEAYCTRSPYHSLSGRFRCQARSALDHKAALR